MASNDEIENEVERSLYRAFAESVRDKEATDEVVQQLTVQDLAPLRAAIRGLVRRLNELRYQLYLDRD